MAGLSRRFVCFVIVFAMTATALSVAPLFVAVKDVTVPEEVAADTAAIGTREVKYTISNMFESYLKPTDYSKLGRHGGVDGLNEWWAQRINYGYAIKILRDKYPFAMITDQYSANIPFSIKDPRMGYSIDSFFRISMDAKNLGTVSTCAGADLQFAPILNPDGLAMDGGIVSWDWYITYLTSQECMDITLGLHYANSYYGVPAGAVKFTGAYANDGEWSELQGKTTFDRESAAKFLGLEAAGDLREQFTVANVGNALGKAWALHWMNEGSGDGKFNIFCAYDYPLDIGVADMFLTLDPSSTADTLVLRLWGHAWGYEFLMMRILEGSAGVMQYDQAECAEDFSLKGTAGPSSGDIQVRCTAPYHLQGWKDPCNSEPTWNLETRHIDWCANNYANPYSGWESRYNIYAARQYYNPAREEWTPGTINYGTRVMYWKAPLERTMLEGETLQIKLPLGTALGYEPFKGTSDVIGEAKVAELRTKAVWGELVLGNGNPADMNNYYDNWSKTITMKGPVSFSAPPNPTYPSLLDTGAPNFMFGVSRVSDYELWIMDPAPYVAGQTSLLRVTCRNISGNVVSDWDGTVNLKAGGAILGETSHVFSAADAGVWMTTIQITDPGSGWILASDQWYPHDVGWCKTWGAPTVTATIDSITPNPVEAGQPVSFYGTGSSVDAEIVSYHWMDGWDYLSSEEDFTTTLTLGGEHLIMLAVKDANGVSSEMAATMLTVIGNMPPTADFTQPTWGQGGILEPVSFDASSSWDAEDSDANLQFRWDFEADGVWDTVWSTSPWVSHIYSTSGQHPVALEVMDTGGLVGQCVKTITVLSHQHLLNARFEKVSTNSSSPQSWLIQPLYSGVTTAALYNAGFKSVVLEVHDVTVKDVKVFRKTIVFSKYGCYPEGGWPSFSFSVEQGHTYKLVLKDFDGPIGSTVDIQVYNQW